ncbi:MAG: helical backbone metal receptor [Planctomycetota bacterium]
MRVVSLNCSNTEIVQALGCLEHLVGVDDDSDHPPELRERLPTVGRDLDVRIAEVAALEPDLVLASLTVPGHEDVIDGLESAGLRFHAPETQSLQDVYHDIRDIAGLLDVPERADPVIDQLQRVVEAPPEPIDTPPTILVQWWPKPVIAPGRRSWVHDLIELAGGRNPLGDHAVKSTPIEDEDLAEIDPDAVVISWCGVQVENYRTDVVLDNPNFAECRFVHHRRVEPIAECYLGRPGPRLAEGSRQLRALIRSLAGC